ncbi:MULTISPECIES: phosphonate metabolism protein/1,5-bisphosphokinase (PRPP-forming) PhnN [unclassified Pseudomonas]|uniref:phosphonate metabolism protein/1,5-bisphosphokinase (PRPP-forming) PhnN n=1 Tax=unclassified Pseudomonas TaxID=196821 RepID=UPI002097913F|nr:MULTISPECIES: phosphonate metabolism protein/1,5-bisphosphokinase (PRPP-forming) PhnN [unclassified Pseudomonas]MCO7518293.1 phosphonate metabolism protein/1,5-bisphosphokinase (PRPP-forming) PhnN [Pseudomonas sp. 1]MCO7542607.1 phosphonate metabolism protein/1,5-bisphosphokinase (PRPP-forming) PhnN [Pseudomonas sp. VA159-2]
MQYDASNGMISRARVILLIGPSGAGKDSLIDAAREPLRARGVEVARRVITRSAEAKGEDAHGVSEAQFQAMHDAGAFALDWQANGLRYGIPIQVDRWLGTGKSVLINGSRGHLAAARRRYPDLLAVGLAVSPQVLRERLLARGRESLEDIEQRLARNARLQAYDADVHVLDNSATLAEALRALLCLLDEQGIIRLSLAQKPTCNLPD